ncbi:hypothetical protein PoMZ_06108 [Pyricularia oryzae]|uniref:Uncharacterized protein n=1 Tax=Pyricularia oryzae TaxID=318829 RepID=A0A4P7NPX3_PYROR|nr:hypothetical protein PoMZ_06108 [Pyricularia oryzae]
MLPLVISHTAALVYITLVASLCHAASAENVPGSPTNLGTEAKTGPLILNKRAKIQDSCTGEDRQQLITAMEKYKKNPFTELAKREYSITDIDKPFFVPVAATSPRAQYRLLKDTPSKWERSSKLKRREISKESSKSIKGPRRHATLDRALAI